MDHGVVVAHNPLNTSFVVIGSCYAQFVRVRSIVSGRRNFFPDLAVIHHTTLAGVRCSRELVVHYSAVTASSGRVVACI